MPNSVISFFQNGKFWLQTLFAVLTVIFIAFAFTTNSDEGGEESSDDDTLGIQLAMSDDVGHPTFSSPHFNPIATLNDLVYVTNTPADTLDIIDTETNEVEFRINVGVDPVSIAVRPDGKEIWVANHVSDTISIIDSDPESDFYHQVIGTVQDVDPDTLQTNFDEPVGIAFATNEKAYVALGPSNSVAIIDVAEREVTGHLQITAQDPRALITRGVYLYVIAFESGNTSQISGCNPESIDGDICTYDAVQHTHTTNNVLSLDIPVDIVKNPKVPDRDLFVFNTRTDRLIDTVEGVGTLLYGLDVSTTGTIYVAQADARNDANGRAGTQGHDLEEMENRAFLNQLTGVNCRTIPCDEPVFLNLEPLPPDHPEEGMALATPYAIKVSDDDSTIVSTAAGSDKVFIIDTSNGEVVGRVAVDAVPRGLSLVSDDEGVPIAAWVLNAVANTVSYVDLSSLTEPEVSATVTLEDPTPELLKQGRIAFNDADASSTGTFSCESCHPDNNVDQIVWILKTPPCASGIEGESMASRCNQVPPRLTMPVRGLRDTQPYHWDGIPGDPYGGVNVRSLFEPEGPTCDMDDPESCTRNLVDGSLGTTMCDLTDCPDNDEGNPGLLDAEMRDALAHYILNIPFPPAPHRPFNNEMSHSAKTGLYEFNYLNNSGTGTGAQACGACHKAPFLTSTNTPSNPQRNINGVAESFNGMDAPTWRGAYDRWIITPQARFNVIDLMERIDQTLLDRDFPEQEMWFHAGARTQANWDMVLEYGTGFSGSFARQVTLNEETAIDDLTSDLLAALEVSAASRGVILQGEGLLIGSDEITPIALEYVDDTYEDRITENTAYTRHQLISMAEEGSLLLTLTGRTGENIGSETPQPALWPYWTIGEDTWEGIEEQSPTVEIPFLTEELSLSFKGRHIQPDSKLYLNGRFVEGTVACETGELPTCDDEIITITFTETPSRYGLNFVQVQTNDGLFSNDAMFYSQQVDKPDLTGNLIVSGGTFSRFEFPLQRFWNMNEFQENDISYQSGPDDHGQRGYIRALIRRVNTGSPWVLQISHTVSVVEGQQYTFCYTARAEQNRRIDSYLDTNLQQWRPIGRLDDTGGTRFVQSITPRWQPYSHTFTATETDITARVAFDFAGSSSTVYVDDIGLYEGSECGDAGVTTEVGFLAGN